MYTIFFTEVSKFDVIKMVKYIKSILVWMMLTYMYPKVTYTQNMRVIKIHRQTYTVNWG